MLRHDRLNELALINGAQQYLEIGVREGATLKKVNVPVRYGVDPKFRFERDQYIAESSGEVHLFEKTSDNFFDELQQNVRFDLVFIDGLHQYDQVVKDLMGSMRHLNPGAIIVIDDTVPTSVAASTRHLSDLGKLMAATGETSKNWMGDVYKVFPFIHIFLRQYEILTFPKTPTLHPQTVIWQKQEATRVTARFSFERPFFRTYEEFLLNFEILNMCDTEQDAFSLIKKNFRILN